MAGERRLVSEAGIGTRRHENCDESENLTSERSSVLRLVPQILSAAPRLPRLHCEPTSHLDWVDERRIEMRAEGRHHWVPSMRDFEMAERDCWDDLVKRGYWSEGEYQVESHNGDEP